MAKRSTDLCELAATEVLIFILTNEDDANESPKSASYNCAN